MDCIFELPTPEDLLEMGWMTEEQAREARRKMDGLPPKDPPPPPKK